MELQEIYDKVKAHLLTQMRKARLNDEDLTCAYRSENGDTCAVGCLIPDDVYYPELEGASVAARSPKILDALEKSVGELSVDKFSLLVQLQNVHDGANVGYWKERLEGIALNYGLTP